MPRSGGRFNDVRFTDHKYEFVKNRLTVYIFPTRVRSMPNQRKKGSKLQTLWLSPEEKEVLKKLAKQQGLTVTAFLKKELNTHLEKNRDQQ